MIRLGSRLGENDLHYERIILSRIFLPVFASASNAGLLFHILVPDTYGLPVGSFRRSRRARSHYALIHYNNSNSERPAVIY